MPARAALADAAGAPALSRAASHEQRPAVTARREPALAAAGDEEDWKEF
jgi:hypothetical protein